jgi:hypothetical protein
MRTIGKEHVVSRMRIVRGLAAPVFLATMAALSTGCAREKPRLDWAFDREERHLANVRLELRVVERKQAGWNGQSALRLLTVDPDRQEIEFQFNVSVIREIEAVNIYSLIERSRDVRGTTVFRRLGEFSDPSGFGTPPSGMMDGSSQIPASVLRPRPKGATDRPSVARYPVTVDWDVIVEGGPVPETVVLTAKDDGRIPLVVQFSGESQQVRLTSRNLQKLKELGYKDYAIRFKLRPGAWSDEESLGVLTGLDDEGTKKYKVAFSIEDVWSAIGR